MVFLTAYLLILFSFLGLSYLGVVQERITDTLIGCAMAFAAGYFLFPRWESEQLTDYMAAALRANLAYLRQLADRLAGQPPAAQRVPPAAQRRVRERGQPRGGVPAHAHRAQKQAAPPHRNPRVCGAEPHSVLQHRRPHRHPARGRARRAALRRPTAAAPSPAPWPPSAKAWPAWPPPPPCLPTELAAPEPNVSVDAADDKLLLEQLTFLQKVSGDISKVTEVLAG